LRVERPTPLVVRPIPSEAADKDDDRSRVAAMLLDGGESGGSQLYLLMLRASANVVLSVCLSVVSSLLGRPLGKGATFFLTFPRLDVP